MDRPTRITPQPSAAPPLELPATIPDAAAAEADVGDTPPAKTKWRPPPLDERIRRRLDQTRPKKPLPDKQEREDAEALRALMRKMNAVLDQWPAERQRQRRMDLIFKIVVVVAVLAVVRVLYR